MKKEKRLLTPAEKKRIKINLRRELSRNKEIIFAYLHGSFLLPVPCGDIDIAIYIEETALTKKHWEYESQLAMSLDRLMSIPVDVLTLNYAPVTLRYHATAGEVLLSKIEPVRFTFLEETWRDYFDCQPTFRAFYRDLLDSR